MIYALWRWLQLWLPFGFILYLYRHHKGLPANIKTNSGRNLKAIMITTDYGILFSEEKYIKNRLKLLVDQQRQIAQTNDMLIKEINELDFIQREKLLGNLKDDNI